jgi:hypothetical protein
MQERKRRMLSIRSSALAALGLALGACSLGSGPGSDGSSPQISIDAPAANATVAGQVPIDITATDDFGVDKVRVLIDGVLLVEMFTPPFHTIWNSQSVTNNTNHVIRVEALDVAKNLGTKEITVMVVNGVQAPPADPR